MPKLNLYWLGVCSRYVPGVYLAATKGEVQKIVCGCGGGGLSIHYPVHVMHSRGYVIVLQY